MPRKTESKPKQGAKEKEIADRQARVQAYVKEAFSKVRANPRHSGGLDDLKSFIAALEAAIEAGDTGEISRLAVYEYNAIEKALGPAGIKALLNTLRHQYTACANRVRAEDERADEAKAEAARQAEEERQAAADRRAEYERLKALEAEFGR